MMLTRSLCWFLLILCLLVGAIGIVSATTEGVNVEAGKEFVYKIDVASTDRVQLTFTTAGQASSNLSFSMVFPNSTIINIGQVGHYSISFTSNATGTFELHFDNSNSTDTEFVALNYNVDHYFFGVPQTIFFLVVIAVLVMVIVSGYIVLGKHSY